MFWKADSGSAKVSAASNGSWNPTKGNIAGLSADPVLRIRTYPNISSTGSGCGEIRACQRCAGVGDDSQPSCVMCGASVTSDVRSVLPAKGKSLLCSLMHSVQIRRNAEICGISLYDFYF